MLNRIVKDLRIIILYRSDLLFPEFPYINASINISARQKEQVSCTKRYDIYDVSRTDRDGIHQGIILVSIVFREIINVHGPALKRGKIGICPRIKVAALRTTVIRYRIRTPHLLPTLSMSKMLLTAAININTPQIIQYRYITQNEQILKDKT